MGNSKYKLLVFSNFKSVIAEILFKKSPRLFDLMIKFFHDINCVQQIIKKCIYYNVLVAESEQRTIYLVTIRKPKVHLKAGISKVETYIYQELTSRKDISFRVIPVYWDGKNFVVNLDNQKIRFQKKYFRMKKEIWNPHKDDLLFFQTFSALAFHDENNLKFFKNKCNIAASVYDILPITKPEWFKDYSSHLFVKIFNLLLSFSDLLIVNSTDTKLEIETYLAKNKIQFYSKIPKIRQVNLWSIATPHKEKVSAFKNDVNQNFNFFLNPDPVLILVSTIEPRKGHRELIEASRQAWEKGSSFNLLFVGQLGWISDSFKFAFEEFLNLEKDRAIWLSGVSDEELERIMQRSDILISPSLGEGYGLPIAEALQRNLPVLANSIPPYQELFRKYVIFYGLGEIYDTLAEALADIENVLALGRELINATALPEISTVSELLNSLMEI